MFVYSNKSQREENIERPIVSVDKWKTLSFDELLEQKDILFGRMEFIAKHNPDNVKIFLEGLAKIDILITEKINEQ
jgi:hypothetical protein